jgi:PKD repeat protein
MAASSVLAHTAITAVKASGTTIGATVSQTVLAGNTLVCFVLFDNAATASKPVVSSITKAAGETNNWVSLGRSLSTSTSLGAFASGEIMAIRTSVNWPAADYTVTLDTTTVMKATAIHEFAGVLTTLRSTTGTAYSTTTTAASATTTGTAPVIGDLAIGFAFASNYASGLVGDNDTTGGFWAGSGFGSTGGSLNTNNFAIKQYKVLTTASHQTYNNNGTLTAGNGSIVAILQANPVSPPVASFSSSATSVVQGQTVTFTDTSTNTPTTWSWNFGTGASPATASTQGPHVVTYNTAGSSAVTLTSGNSAGSDPSNTTNITVSAPPAPVASFSSSATSVVSGSTVIFTDTSTNTPTGWSWDFGTGASPATASTQGPHVVTYSTEGTSSVTLTVTNAGGSDAVDAPTSITVTAPPPTGITLLTGAGDATTVNPGATTSLASPKASKPANTVTGDLLVAVVAHQQTITSAGAVLRCNDPAWVLAGPPARTNSTKRPSGIWVLPVTNAATLDDTNWIWQGQATAGRWLVRIYRVTGVDLTTPVDAAADEWIGAGGGTTSTTMDDLTTVTNNALVVYHLHGVNTNVQGAMIVTKPTETTFVEQIDNVATGTASSDSIGVWTEVRPSAGAVGSRVFTTTTQAAFDGYNIALRPLTAPPAPSEGGRPKVYISSAFQTAPGKVNIPGTGWMEKPWKKYDAGAGAWVLINPEGGPPPATASVVSYASIAQTAGQAATSFTMTLPSGLTTGDRIYIAAICSDSSAGSVVTESKTGWTTVTAKADIGTSQTMLYTATYAAGLTAPSWTLSAARRCAYVAVAVRDARTPVESTGQQGTLSTDIVAPSVTATGEGIALRLYVKKDNLSTSITDPSGHTMIVESVGTAAGPAAHAAAYYIAVAGAGATGTATATFNSATSLNSMGWTIAL